MLQDGDIVGIDRDGRLLLWNGTDSVIYNCGETPTEFGLRNIRPSEWRNILMAKTYTVTITRLVTDLLSARVSVPALSEAEAIEKAKAFWEAGNVELVYTSQASADPVEFEAVENTLT